MSDNFYYMKSHSGRDHPKIDHIADLTLYPMSIYPICSVKWNSSTVNDISYQMCLQIVLGRQSIKISLTKRMGFEKVDFLGISWLLDFFLENQSCQKTWESASYKSRLFSKGLEFDLLSLWFCDKNQSKSRHIQMSSQEAYFIGLPPDCLSIVKSQLVNKSQRGGGWYYGLAQNMY